MIWLILLLLVLLPVLAVVLALFLILWPQRKPAKPIAPKQFRRDRLKPHEKVVLIFGDSITQGTISHNYVVDLQKQLGSKGFRFINAGINGDLAYNLLQRIDDVIACKPDYVVIMVGTNDAMASSTPEKSEEFILMKTLPQTPTFSWFTENLTTIVTRLQTELNPHIALLSLGLYGENLSSQQNQRWQQFSQAIEEIAAQKEVAYLPLHETMRVFLATSGPKADYTPDDGKIDEMMRRAIALQRPFLRKSYTKIGKENGFDLLSDGLHFNETAGKMVADLITTWLRDQYKFRRYSDKDRTTERHGD